ncbi:MAG: AAA family ATPase [archaeon]
MKLKKITLNNIRSYESQEINFPVGSTLLSGDIGSGKTSVLLGIEFALFGLQPGQRGTSLLRNGKKTGGVVMVLEIEGQDIVIERTLKRVKTVNQDYCAITIEDEKKEISVSELKNKVLDLLNYPKEFAKKQNLLYKFTVYTPQEEMKQIVLQDSETRMNTIRHIFGIDKYKTIIENSSIILSKIREEKRLKEGITLSLEQDRLDIISKENELEIKGSNLTSIEKELFLKSEVRKKKQEEKDDIFKKIEERNKIKQEIEKTKIMVANKKESIVSNKKVIEQLEKQVEELKDTKYDENKVVQLEREITLEKDKKRNLDSDILEINSQIASFNSKNEDAKKQEMNLSNLEKCPTCLQDVDSIYRANALNKLHSDFVENKKQIERLKQEKKIFLEKLIGVEKEIVSREKEITELRILKVKLESVQEKKLRLVDIEKSNTALEKDMVLLENQVESLKTIVFELSKFDNVYEAKQREFDEAMKDERMVEIKVAELRKEIEVFSSQIKELKEKVKRAEELRKEVNYLAELESWLSKEFVPVISLIERNVMVKLKVDFSDLFSKWFIMIVSDSFNIKLSDDFTPIIEYQDYEIGYSDLSGGERTAVALAYRLALNQVINSLLSKIKTRDIVILDEPTDGFSDQQLDKIRDVLQELNVGQLIIVSHEQKIEGFVENVIKFRKEAGMSVVEE